MEVYRKVAEIDWDNLTNLVVGNNVSEVRFVLSYSLENNIHQFKHLSGITRHYVVHILKKYVHGFWFILLCFGILPIGPIYRSMQFCIKSSLPPRINIKFPENFIPMSEKGFNDIANIPIPTKKH